MGTEGWGLRTGDWGLRTKTEFEVLSWQFILGVAVFSSLFGIFWDFNTPQ